MKTLTFDEKYGDIREDGLTVIQEQPGAGWPELAREIVGCVNMFREVWASPRWEFQHRIDDEEDALTDSQDEAEFGEVTLSDAEIEMLRKFELEEEGPREYQERKRDA